MRKIKGEGEPGTEPCPIVATLASHGHGHGGHVLRCSLCHSHAALWIVTTSTVWASSKQNDKISLKYKVAIQYGYHCQQKGTIKGFYDLPSILVICQ